MILVLKLSVILTSSYSQQLRLEWDIQALPQLDLYLFHTSPDGAVRQITSELQKGPTLGFYEVDLPILEGRYQVFVVNPEYDHDFADWASYKWVDYVKVTYKGDNFQIQITPRPNSGALWHAMDLLGEEFKPVIVNQILPRRLMVFGQVVNLETGAPIPQVLAKAHSNNVAVSRDLSNKRGIYLLFLSEDEYQIVWESPRIISQTAFVNLRQSPFPHRRNMVLHQENPKEHIIIVKWDLYPEDVTLELKSNDSIIKAEPVSPDSIFKRIVFTPSENTDYELVVSPVQESERVLFAYSELNVTVFTENAVVTRTLPLGHRSSWTAFRFQSNLGWIESE
jgi:hypothetical protein